MKRVLVYLLFTCVIAVILHSCNKDRDEYFTMLVIRLDFQQNISIEHIQSSIVLTNVNTKQVLSRTQMDTLEPQIELLKGFYQVSVRGQLSWISSDGEKIIKDFVSKDTYWNVTAKEKQIKNLSIILLD